MQGPSKAEQSRKYRAEIDGIKFAILDMRHLGNDPRKKIEEEVDLKKIHTESGADVLIVIRIGRLQADGTHLEGHVFPACTGHQNLLKAELLLGQYILRTSRDCDREWNFSMFEYDASGKIECFAKQIDDHFYLKVPYNLVGWWAKDKYHIETDEKDSSQSWIRYKAFAIEEGSF